MKTSLMRVFTMRHPATLVRCSIVFDNLPLLACGRPADVSRKAHLSMSRPQAMSCRLVKWDMRDPRGVVQDLSSPVVGYESGKDYSRGTNFTCMATTGVLDCGVSGHGLAQ